MFDLIILCGGKGTRLSPLTDNLPKSMIDINGKPFIYHQLKLLEKSGFTKVVLCVGHLGNIIEDYIDSIKSDFHMKILFSYDGEELLGTGGSIKNALPLLNNRFFVIYGDSYLPVKYMKIEGDYVRNNKSGLMVIWKNRKKDHQNNVDYVNDEIVCYNKEEPTGKYIDYGIGVFNQYGFNKFKKDKFDLAEYYQFLIEHNQLSSFVVEKQFYEIGSLKGIEEFSNYIKDKENK